MTARTAARMMIWSGAATAAAVGLVPSAARGDGPGTLDEFIRSSGPGAFVYISARTGEQVVTPAGGPRWGDLVWQNSDTSCGYWIYGQDRPTRDTVATGRAKFGSAVVNWGDIPPGTSIGAFDVAYATDIGPPISVNIPGLDMINVFLDRYDGVLEPGGTTATPVGGFRFTDILGAFQTEPSGPLFPFNIYFVDLEGSGLEFQFGADDLDGDGLHDFGYSYEFVQGQTSDKGVIGPLLVRPASLGGAGSATTSPDLHDWFNQTSGGPGSFTEYVGAFTFHCDCRTGPYSVFYLDLYGLSGLGPCGVIDYNTDHIIDFSDYLEFLARFDGRGDDADLNHDGVVDFADYLEFLNLYDACAS